MNDEHDDLAGLFEHNRQWAAQMEQQGQVDPQDPQALKGLLVQMDKMAITDNPHMKYGSI